MQTFRKLVAMVLLLLIHLLTLQIGDAGTRNHTSDVSHVRNDPRKVILEEMTVAGSGNNTRVIANAVLAEDASRLDDEVLSLLQSKRETRPGSGYPWKTPRSDREGDQDAAQSSATVVSEPHDEVDDLGDDVEIMSRVIARYEPQRLTSRKTKRRIGVDRSNGTHDVDGKIAKSRADLEKAYAEVLRNISRKAPVTVRNDAATSNPYLSLAVKQFKKIYSVPEVQTIRPAANGDGAEKRSRPEVNSSFTSPILHDADGKKSRRLLKKYSQLNRTATTPRFSSVEESDEESGETGKPVGTPAGHFKVSNGKTRSKNGSATASNVYSGPTEEPKSRYSKWTFRDFSFQPVTPFTSLLNNSNSNNVINAKGLRNLNVPSDANAARSPPRYKVVPRPFSISPDSFVTPSVVDASYGKPSPSPASFSHRRQQATGRSSSASVLPLVLPTDLFSPPAARRYLPIKRANHLARDSTTVVGTTEASPPASPPVAERTTLANYDAVYKAVIGATTSPSVTTAADSQRSYDPSGYYRAIAESPTERTVTGAGGAINFAATYIPGQTSAAPFNTGVQQQQGQNKVSLQAGARRSDSSPGIAAYDNAREAGRSSLNENAGIIARYDKFASLHSANIPNALPNAPRAITPDFRQPAAPSSQVPARPYATLKPLAPTLLKVRPIATSKSTPYYDSRLFVSQDADEERKRSNDEKVETNERPRAEDADDEIEEEDYDDNDNVGNYKTQVDRGAYKVYKTSNKQREREDREEEEKEDRYPQQSRSYGRQDERYEYNENNGSKNDDRREKDENVRRENNNDEEEVDETEEEEEEEEYDRRNKDKGNDSRHYQYDQSINKYKYDRDNSDEAQRERPRYDRKKYDKPKDRRDKHESDIGDRLKSNSKYSKSLYNDEQSKEAHERSKEYRDRSDKKKLEGAKQHKEDRQDRQDRIYKEAEDESAAEVQPFVRRSKDQRLHGQDEKYEEEQNDDDDKRKYHRHQAVPRGDYLPREEREEYGETNPAHTREEYHRQRARDDHRDHHGHDNKDQDDAQGGVEEAADHVHGETQEHAHKHEEHHEKKKDGGDHKFEEGGGEEHEKEHHGHEGEKGEKGYKVWHEHEKAEKGHHDKEQASKHYDEKDGEEKKHEEEGGYHEEHHHDEDGKKTAEFGEKGEHKKGHTTHGEHSVHKKDEYEKNTEFFDEFHEDGEAAKHGEHHHEHESKKGGHEKKGHHDSADHEEKHGKEEKHEKGGHHHEHKGHKIDEGHDHHYDHDHKHGKKEGHEHGKKWSFKKGDDGDHKHNR
ncbi:PREDICTED: uncharacterized protein LOC105448497 [Wasmannia auropunctata]|uniref:uncharacterized protein LOC105448497 n=1 Tax=Wasmannia auropunctata TaxID=64793 RepID=UPI0005EE7117|nr:PREDICTED: uncharacterized protein LOC105448497 [Wasmannia auropunctata]